MLSCGLNAFVAPIDCVQCSLCVLCFYYTLTVALSSFNAVLITGHQGQADTKRLNVQHSFRVQRCESNVLTKALVKLLFSEAHGCDCTPWRVLSDSKIRSSEIKTSKHSATLFATLAKDAPSFSGGLLEV